MISVIIPCTDKSAAEQTVQSVKANIVGAREFIIVLDGSGTDSVICENGIKYIHLKGLNGSYTSRNIGAKYAQGDYFLFIDSGTCVRGDLSEKMTSDVPLLFGARVEFSCDPNDAYEEWYSINAFPVERFLGKFGFVPTIFLLVDANSFIRLNGFDDSFLSSGDADFCHRFRQFGRIQIAENLRVVTDLRAKEQILMKIERQVLGQLVLLQKEHKTASAFALVLLRIVKNLLGLSGQCVSRAGRVSMGLVAVNYRISLKKVGMLLVYGFRTSKALRGQLERVNSAEVSK